MVVKSFKDKVLLKRRSEVLRLHLYMRFLQYGIKPYENDMDIIIELYLFGGYKNPEEQAEFINSCLKKKLKKSDQSIRNTLSKYVSLGIFEKPKNSILYISEDFVPKVEFDKLILQHTVSHAD